MRTDRARIWKVSILNAYFSFFQIWLSLNVRKFMSTMGSKSILRRIWICIGFHEIFSFYLALIFLNMLWKFKYDFKKDFAQICFKPIWQMKKQQLKLGISVLKIKLVETKNVEFTSRNYILFKLSRYLFWMSKLILSKQVLINGRCMSFVVKVFAIFQQRWKTTKCSRRQWRDFSLVFVE